MDDSHRETGESASRVLVDRQPGSGGWNMAVDAVLLDTAAGNGISSLRLYRWSEPTVSLGYFQSLDAICDYPHLKGVPAVRRLSGGGAIVHDDELTYSLALAASHPLAKAPRELYTLVHQKVIGVLASLGVAAALRGLASSIPCSDFLCFGRRDDFDVVLEGRKILGSAQRRRKGAVLQHGSLILKRSAIAPQFPGICDLSPVTADPGTLCERLAEAIGGLLSPAPVFSSLTPDEILAAEERLLRGDEHAASVDGASHSIEHDTAPFENSKGADRPGARP